MRHGSTAAMRLHARQGNVALRSYVERALQWEHAHDDRTGIFSVDAQYGDVAIARYREGALIRG
jgi:hypothetical protein